LAIINILNNKPNYISKSHFGDDLIRLYEKEKEEKERKKKKKKKRKGKRRKGKKIKGKKRKGKRRERDKKV